MFENSLQRVFLLAALLTVARVVSGTDTGATLELIEANPSQGFHFPYYLRTPTKPRVGESGTVLLVETNNTGTVDDEIAKHVQSAHALASGRGVSPFVSARLGLPLLVPAFPRPRADPHLYTHAMDRDSMLVKSGPLARLDLQLLAMIDDGRRRLAERGLPIREKFLMCGFSASGTFANRFAFIHPERLLGVAAGGINAFPMLPISEHKARRLVYPVGVGDLAAISGSQFNATHWRALPQLIFMGALDDNDAVRYDDAYSDEERELIYVTVGRRMQPDRWQAVQRIYLEQPAAVTFITYGEVGHWTNRRINQDVTNFLESVLLELEKNGT